MSTVYRHRLLPWAAAIWLVGGAGYLILEGVVAAAFRPHYSYADDLISDLGVTSGGGADSPLAGLMNIGFYLQGTAFLVGAFLVAHTLARPAAAFFVILAATNAVGNILVGTVHGAGSGGLEWLHGTGAVLAILGGNGAILTGFFLVGQSAPYRIGSLGLAAFGLVCFTLFAVGAIPAGLWERGSVYTIISWQLVTAAYLLARRVPSSSEHSQDAQPNGGGRRSP